jgi:hypothetical protein
MANAFVQEREAAIGKELCQAASNRDFAKRPYNIGHHGVHRKGNGVSIAGSVNGPKRHIPSSREEAHHMNQAGYARSIKRSRRRTGNMRVSSSLSKIPYGGFSPVRLQTGSMGIPPRPSQAGTDLSARPAFLRHPLTYTRLLFLSPKRANSYRKGTCVQAVLPSSDANLPVQRSLAPQRVLLSRQISAYYDLIRASRSHRTIYGLFTRPSPLGLFWAGTEKVPNLSCLSVTPCRLLYPGSWMTALGCCLITHASLPP